MHFCKSPKRPFAVAGWTCLVYIVKNRRDRRRLREVDLRHVDEAILRTSFPLFVPSFALLLVSFTLLVRFSPLTLSFFPS